MKKPAAPKTDAVVPESGASDKPLPAPKRRSAMKLPAGVTPKASGAPPAGKGPAWDRAQHGRPQRDAARRAGKSRKVH